MRRFFPGFFVGIVAFAFLLGLSSPASASPFWCEDDPFFHFAGGATVGVVTGFSSEYLTASTVVRYDLVLAPGQAVETVMPPSLINAVVRVQHSASQPDGTATLTVRVTGASNAGNSTTSDTRAGGGGFPVTVTTTGGVATTYHGSSVGIRVTFATR